MLTLGLTLVALLVLKLHIIDCDVADIKQLLAIDLPVGLQVTICCFFLMGICCLFFAGSKE